MLGMLWIAILGGLLVMMGQPDRSEASFYSFRLEDQVPENHLLRLIDKHISFRVRTGATERQLQRNRTTVDRSRTPAAHSVQ
jgi:transposase